VAKLFNSTKPTKTPPQVVLVQSEPVPSQDKGGGFRGGFATCPGKKQAGNRNNATFSLL